MEIAGPSSPGKEDGWEMPPENGDMNFTSFANEAVDFEAERQAARKLWTAQTYAQVNYDLWPEKQAIFQDSLDHPQCTIMWQ
jgi:hypothetical protein